MTDQNEQAVPEVEETEAEAVAADENQQAEPEISDEQKADDSAGDNAGASRSKGAERRIRQLTRKYREAERLNKDLLNRLDAIEDRLGPIPEPPRPQRDDFETSESYEDALFDWRDKKRQMAEPQQAENTAAQPETDQEVPFVDEFKQELGQLDDPDAIGIVMDDDWPCTKDMTEFILSSDHRADLAYFLATNPDISGKIAQMSPAQRARELVKVEGELPTKQTGATQSEQPPPPMTPSKATGATGTEFLSDKMSTDQWVNARRRQLDERR